MHVYAYHIGYGFMVLMIMQAALLATMPGVKWSQRAKRYRCHQWCSIGAVAVTVLILLGLAIAPNGGVVAEPHKPPYGSVFTVFFLGFLRTVVETRLPKSVVKSKNLLDAFLIGLFLTLIIDLVLQSIGSEANLLKLLAYPLNTFAGFFGALAFVIVFLAWSYSLLVRQMVNVDLFSGPVVDDFLLKSVLPEVPLQIVMIGPKKAGKSKVMSSMTGIDYQLLKDTLVPTPGSHTARVSSPPKERVALSLIDTPGENMGQHLAAAIQFRTDVLALMINSKAIKWDTLSETPPAQMSLRMFLTNAIAGDAVETDGDQEVDLGQRMREYLEALRFATRGSVPKETKTVSNADALQVVYKVHTFCLVVYNAANTPLTKNSQDNLGRLAIEIGRMFGLNDIQCAYTVLPVIAVSGNVNSQEFTDAVAVLALRN